MQGLLRLVAALGVAAVLVAIGRGLHRPVPTGVPILVPAYFYPGGEGLAGWDELAAAARRVPLLVVLNPASGPGMVADFRYLAAARRLRSAGAKLLGYVHTSYAARDFEQVCAEVDAYQRLYRVDGYFLDEMGNKSDDAGYYARLRDHIRAWDRDLTIVGNAGLVVPESFVKRRLADHFVIYEGPADRFAIHLSPNWMRAYAPSRFGAIVHHAASRKDMERALDVVAKQHLGFLFVGDGTGANPYDRLPGYWAEELAARDRLAAGAEASPRAQSDDPPR